MRTGRQSITLVTGPTAEPVTLAEAKAWARIDGDTEDALLEQLITTARVAAEQYIRGSIISQTRKLTLDLYGSGLADNLADGVYDLPVTVLYGGLPQQINLPAGPVQSITSVVTYDLSNAATTYSADNYSLDSAGDRLFLNYGAIWPSNMRQRAACAITYVTGYGDTSTSVPQPIKTAILIHVATLYEQRGQCDGQMDLPPASKQLLNQYRKLGSRG